MTMTPMAARMPANVAKKMRKRSSLRAFWRKTRQRPRIASVFTSRELYSNQAAEEKPGHEPRGQTVIGKGVQRLEIVALEEIHQEGGAGIGGDRRDDAADGSLGQADARLGAAMHQLRQLEHARPGDDRRR